jgi:EAL domain-containing protein (putative c-di-GMP-specific phosphodiesterase class I)
MKRCIQVCHSDDALVAEMTFWAASAGYELVPIKNRSDLLEDAGEEISACVFELSGKNDEEVDLIEVLSKRRHGKIIVVTQLDNKTITSVRRLFQQKAIEAILLARADFNTVQLAELLKSKEGTPTLDRQTLAKSIADGHVIVHYQPKVPFRQGEGSYGVEALCRIQHPELGLIFPDNFIPLAEAHGLILELTDAVTVQAFRDLRAWDSQGRTLRLAINISPQLMSSMTWFELFEHRCQEHQIDPKRITLEVTESSSQGGKVLALEILSRLRLKGFLLSIDDFGTGFSSLETLYKLPFGELKIDKQFVFDLIRSPEARTLVESTVGLARKLGLKVCAEGVETEELFQELRSLQCDDAQGYYISRPIIADAIAPFFENWDAANAARSNSSAFKLKAIHGLLAEILSGPDDGDDATIVVSSAPKGLSPESGRDIASKLPALILRADLLGALELVHRAVRLEQESDFRRKLLSLQSELERSLLTDGVALTDGQRTIELRAGQSFTIGRESSSANADVAIPCRWLSRGSKNLRLFIENAQWQISDIGSTNGHFLDGKRLDPNIPVPLPTGMTVLEVGKSGSDPAPAWLGFRLTHENSVEISFGTSDESGAQPNRRWLVFHQEASVGAAGDAGLVISDSGPDFIADIRYSEQGFWISPRPGRAVLQGEFEFSQSVPLVLGSELHFGLAKWQIVNTIQTDTKPEVSRPAAAYA